MWRNWTHQTKLSKIEKGREEQEFKKKQKAYMSWENEDDSSTDSDDDEVENICLMANDEKILNSPPLEYPCYVTNNRFKTAFNEELYNTIVKNKKVIAECCIDLDEDEYPEVKEQISLRGWRRLLAPK
ncbi:hypothetical protein PIB30_088447 [Stylosanthes scabra]|uniref:Uncharacterized protein n=1 Tax=Stylosanthes scabra TaxID=79078 RepID=A0ABU6RTW3_9FABA|nr:hypothetical protein [Stylosanthes scabra]